MQAQTLATIAGALCLAIPQAHASTLTDVESDITAIVEHVGPAVVSVEVVHSSPGCKLPPSGHGRHWEIAELHEAEEHAERESRVGEARYEADEPLGIFAGVPAAHERARRTSGTCGVIYHDSLHVLTCADALDDADEITVTLADGRHFDASLVGMDRDTGIAVLAIDEQADDLPDPPPVGDSSALRPGQFAIIIGPQGGSPHAVRLANIAATGRTPGLLTFEDFLQISAGVHPGTGGAAVFDSAGKLIGLMCSSYGPKPSRLWAKSEPYPDILRYFGSHELVGPPHAFALEREERCRADAGFAIPIHVAGPAADQLIEKGKVSRGWLGVQIRPATATGGVIVEKVIPGTPAADAGFQQGDRIAEVNGQTIEGVRALQRAVASLQPGATATFKIARDGDELTVPVKIGLRPDTATPGAAAALRLGLDVSRPETESGALIAGVSPSSAAENAGLRAGDRIVAVNEITVASPDDLYAALEATRDQFIVRVTVIRDGEEKDMFLQRR